MNHQAVLTPNQQAVWNALSVSEAPLGAYALLEQLKGSNFKAPLQVYRALDKLIEFRMVHRLESLNAFVACAHSHDRSGPMAFAICDTCGQVKEFADAHIARGLDQWSRSHSFKPTKVTVELHGLCEDCQEGRE